MSGLVTNACIWGAILLFLCFNLVVHTLNLTLGFQSCQNYLPAYFDSLGVYLHVLEVYFRLGLALFWCGFSLSACWKFKPWVFHHHYPCFGSPLLLFSFPILSVSICLPAFPSTPPHPWGVGAVSARPALTSIGNWCNFEFLNLLPHTVSATMSALDSLLLGIQDPF